MGSINTDIIRQRVTHMINEASRKTLYGVVKEIDVNNRVCEVQIEDIIYSDVLLFSVKDESKKGYVIIPSLESTVLITRIDNSERFFVTMFSEVDEIIFTKSDVTFKITENGFSMTKDNVGLKKTINDLLEALKLMQVTTGTGPSGVPLPDSQKRFENIQEDLDKYMEG